MRRWLRRSSGARCTSGEASVDRWFCGRHRGRERAEPPTCRLAERVRHIFLHPNDRYCCKGRDEARRYVIPILRRALNRSTIALTRRNAAPIRAVKGGIGSSRLYRFTGSVGDHDASIACSLILKVLAEPVGNDKREVAFYRSTVAQAFPPGLRPAHCYAISEQVDATGRPEYWLWLEDVAPHARGTWSLDDHHQQQSRCGRQHRRQVRQPGRHLRGSGKDRLVYVLFGQRGEGQVVPRISSHGQAHHIVQPERPLPLTV